MNYVIDNQNIEYLQIWFSSKYILLDNQSKKNQSSKKNMVKIQNATFTTILFSVKFMVIKLPCKKPDGMMMVGGGG